MIKIQLNKGELLITPYEENIIRIQINLLSSFKESPSCLLENLTQINSDLKKVDQKTFEFSTKKIKIKINVDPLSLEFIDLSDNSIFLKDLEENSYFAFSNTIRHTVYRNSNDYYYGFGESSGKINKNGRRLRIDAVDAFGYDAKTSDPLYKHCPFFITLTNSKKVYVTLYNTFRRGVLDMGCEISAWKGSFRYYEEENNIGQLDYVIILGNQMEEVSKGLITIIGAPLVPPAWSLGYLGSGMTRAELGQEYVEKFCDLCEEYSMPCDGFHLSSGYTLDETKNSRNVFTWNSKTYPDPKKMFEKFNKNNIKIIANVKPWLLENHPKHKESHDLFLKDKESNQNSIQSFWKGGLGTSAKGSYFDFTNPDTFKWWKSNLKENLLSLGCNSVWNDNNEFEILDGEKTIISNGQSINFSGRAYQTYLMAKSSREALDEIDHSSDRFLVSRAGSIGTHKLASQTWSGDNTTSWKTLKWNIPMCLSLGLTGWIGNGPDIGGFAGGKPSKELFLRWVQLGCFLPRFSIHSSAWKSQKEEELSSVNEPWMYPEIMDEIRNVLQMRVLLRAFLYSLYIDGSLKGLPVVRPLVYHYSNIEECLNESFEFTLGRDILIVPITEPEIEELDALLPYDDIWLDLEHERIYKHEKKHVKIELKNRKRFGVPVFMRRGGILMLSGNKFEKNIHKGSQERIFYTFPDSEKQEWSFYSFSKDKFFIKKEGNKYNISKQKDFQDVKVIEYIEKDGKIHEIVIEKESISLDY